MIKTIGLLNEKKHCKKDCLEIEWNKKIGLTKVRNIMAGVNIKINFNSIASQNFGNQIWWWEKKWKVSTFRAFDPSLHCVNL